MKDDNYTDRAIGRKLASYSVKPENLTFGKVRKNYLERKKLRLKYGVLRTIALLFSVAGFAVAAYFLIPRSSNITAGGAQSMIDAPADPSSNYTTADGARSKSSVEACVKTPDASPTNKQSHATIIVENESPAVSSEENGAKSTGKFSAAEKNTSNNSRSESLQTSSASGMAASTDSATEDPPSAESGTKALAGLTTKKAPAQGADNKKPVAKKNVGRQNNYSTETTDHSSPQTVSSRENPSSKKINTRETGTTSAETNNPRTNNDASGISADGIAPKSGNSQSKSENTTESQAGRAPNDSDKESSTQTEQNRIKSEKTENVDETYNVEPAIALYMDTPLKNKTLVESSAPLSHAAASLSPVKHHYFLLSPEVSWNSFTSRLRANSETDSISGLAKDKASNQSRSFSGGLILGYKYRNAGINTGLQFFNIESQVSTDAFTQSQDIYSRQVKVSTTITHSVVTSTTVIPPPVGDTIIRPTVITSTAVITLTLTQVDTTYINTGKRSYVLVSGDTVSPRNYINQVRFFTIPFSVNYSINLWKKKLLLEPEAGIQLGIPIKSYQLVTENERQFSYSRTKFPLKNHFLLFDLSLKINYRLSRNLIVYFKQGYFFSSKSVYAGNYPIKSTMSNTYSSFGLSFPID